MSIIGQHRNKIELSKAEKQQRTRKRLIQGVNSVYQQMTSTLEFGFNAVYGNNQGLTPQEVFDAFGTDAVEMLRLSAILQETLIEAHPEIEAKMPSHPYELIPNEDGTVTVGQSSDGDSSDAEEPFEPSSSSEEPEA